MHRRWIWFLAGAATTLAAQRVSSAFNLRPRPRPRLVPQRSKPRTPALPITVNDRLQLGGHTIEWMLLSWARYTPDRIHCRYDDQTSPLVPDLAALLEEYTEDWRRRRTMGEAGLPFNGKRYKLKQFDLGQRELRGGEEVPILHLEFGPTDYFTQLVTDLNVGNPVRDRYAATVDLTERPAPEFASNLGHDLNLVTADGYLIVTEKSQRSHKGGGCLASAVGEGFMRPTDADSAGAPDSFQCMVRGAREEFGITLTPDQIEFTGFGVDPRICEYSLIGWAPLKETRAEVEALRSAGVPQDKWEARRLHFIPLEPAAVAHFVVSHRDRWLPEGQAAVALSLLQGDRYSWSEINAAFARAYASE